MIYMDISLGGGEGGCGGIYSLMYYLCIDITILYEKASCRSLETGAVSRKKRRAPLFDAAFGVGIDKHIDPGNAAVIGRENPMTACSACSRALVETRTRFPSRLDRLRIVRRDSLRSRRSLFPTGRIGRPTSLPDSSDLSLRLD
jgi:hypothetical protein